MENIQPVNIITTDASPCNSTDTKKAKKNKRKYWKRKNSKQTFEIQPDDQEVDNIGDVTPGTNSDTFESEDLEDDTENQEEQDIESANEEINADIDEKHSEIYTMPNAKGDSIVNTVENRQANEENINMEQQAQVSDRDVIDGQMFSCSSLPQVEVAAPKLEHLQPKSIEEPVNKEDSIPLPLYNTRYLTKDKITYEVENSERNVMIVFNHYDVHGYKPRLGTDKDVTALKDTFGNLGFKENTLIYNDLTYNQLRETLGEFSRSNFTDFGCVVVVVLTHGKDGGYLMAQDRSYPESELISHFFDKNNHTLITKPIVFIVQACRGEKISHAKFVATAAIERDTAKDKHVYTLPMECDVLLLHSTFAGKVSHRETLNGSWFIQTLCKYINRFADTMDLVSIMTEVTKDVAINKEHEVYNRGTGKMDIDKQIPVAMSTLIRKLYLKKQKNLTIQSDNKVDASEQYSIVDAPVCDNSNLVADNRRFVFPKHHFLHMRNVLRLYHSHKHHTVQPGQLLLNIANSIDEDVTPDATMDATSNEISDYMRAYAKEWECYSMIQFLS